MARGNRARKKPPAIQEPTRERAAKGHVVEREAFDERGLRVMARAMQAPIDRLLARGSVTKRQWGAADRLRDDYLLGVEGARDPEAKGGSGPGVGPVEAQLLALSAFKAAMRILGARLSPIVLAVVCLEENVSAVAKRLCCNTDHASALLGAALDILADGYRLPDDRLRDMILIGDRLVELVYRIEPSGRCVALLLGGVPVDFSAADDIRLLVEARRHARSSGIDKIPLDATLSRRA